MEENITVVFHGFLNLPNLEKLKLVEAINEHFDSNGVIKVMLKSQLG